MKSATDKEIENFLHNVKWLRKHYGLSKKRMAELLKISIKTLNKIENGELPPKLSSNILLNIYYYFGIRPNEQVGQRLGD